MNDIVKSSSTRLGSAPAGLLLAFAGIVTLVLTQQLATVGGNGLMGETLTNAAHIPLFALLALLLVPVLGFPSWWVLVLACLGIGVATEALQGLTGRNASLFDLGLDLLGALPVIAAVAATRRLRERGEARRRIVAVWAVAGGLVAVMTAVAPLRVAVAFQDRDDVFPAVLLPGRWQLAPLLSSNSRMRLIPGPDDWPGFAGTEVLEVVWADHRYPGVLLSEVVPEWGGYEALAVDVYLPEGAPMTLTAAVGHQGSEGTAAYLRRTVEPGAQRLLYDLDTLLTAAEPSPRISRLILHTSRSDAGRTLLIGAAALVRTPQASLATPRALSQTPRAPFQNAAGAFSNAAGACSGRRARGGDCRYPGGFRMTRRQRAEDQ